MKYVEYVLVGVIGVIMAVSVIVGCFGMAGAEEVDWKNECLIKRTLVKGKVINYEICLEDYGEGLEVEVISDDAHWDSCQVVVERLPNMINILRRMNKRAKAGTLDDLMNK